MGESEKTLAPSKRHKYFSKWSEYESMKMKWTICCDHQHHHPVSAEKPWKTVGWRLRRCTVQNIIKTRNEGTSFVEKRCSISAAELQTLEKSMLWCTEADPMVSYKDLLCWFIKSTVQPTKCDLEWGRVRKASETPPRNVSATCRDVAKAD